MNDFMNRYIDEDGELVLLTQDVLASYKNKTVNLYTPMTCKRLKNGCICEKCAGKQTSKFPGLDSNKLATTLTNYFPVFGFDTPPRMINIFFM